MGKEIERKFLVNGDKYRENSSKTYYKQGYLSVDKERTVASALPEIRAL